MIEELHPAVKHIRDCENLPSEIVQYTVPWFCKNSVGLASSILGITGIQRSVMERVIAGRGRIFLDASKDPKSFYDGFDHSDLQRVVDQLVGRGLLVANPVVPVGHPQRPYMIYTLEEKSSTGIILTLCEERSLDISQKDRTEGKIRELEAQAKEIRETLPAIAQQNYSRGLNEGRLQGMRVGMETLIDRLLCKELSGEETPTKRG